MQAFVQTKTDHDGLQDSYGGESEIVGLEWYSGQERYYEPGCAALAVCLCTGQMQLMTDELDDTCLVINTGMQVSNIKWNSNGSVLAVSGVIANSNSPAAAVVQFYSCYGEDSSPVALSCPFCKMASIMVGLPCDDVSPPSLSVGAGVTSSGIV